MPKIIQFTGKKEKGLTEEGIKGSFLCAQLIKVSIRGLNKYGNIKRSIRVDPSLPPDTLKAMLVSYVEGRVDDMNSINAEHADEGEMGDYVLEEEMMRKVVPFLRSIEFPSSLPYEGSVDFVEGQFIFSVKLETGYLRKPTEEELKVFTYDPTTGTHSTITMNPEPPTPIK
jgi:hypothetical protein